MQQVATIPSANLAIVDEHDLQHIHSNPLNTASGFVLGTMLSSALWTAVGVVAWCLT